MFFPHHMHPHIGQNISNTFSSTSSFQSKASILDNMPSQHIKVGDISIAYKQIGKADAKPIIFDHWRRCNYGYVESTFNREASWLIINPKLGSAQGNS